MRDMWVLLGLLAEHRTTLLSRRRAEALIWPGTDVPADRFASLLKETRARLCEVLGRPNTQGRYLIQYIGSTGYRINAAFFDLDVWRLRDALRRAASSSGEARGPALAAAVELYSGAYLPTCEHEWARDTARALDRDVAQALADLAKVVTDPGAAVGHLERATQIAPGAEHLYRLRIQAYADLGRTEAIHNCYAQLEDRLGRLGQAPEAQTVRLYSSLTVEG